jgi:hypothetical protein
LQRKENCNKQKLAKLNFATKTEPQRTTAYKAKFCNERKPLQPGLSLKLLKTLSKLGQVFDFFVAVPFSLPFSFRCEISRIAFYAFIFLLRFHFRCRSLFVARFQELPFAF